MIQLYAWMLLITICIANCGFWLFCFNRVNATGMPRKLTKALEKSCIVLCFAIPTVIAVAEGPAVVQWLLHARPHWWPGGAPWFNSYGGWCLAFALVVGPVWLESRRWIWPPHNLLQSHCERHDLHRSVPGGSPGTALTKFLNSVPGNQITQLDVTTKTLQLPRRLPALDGFRIGHLSDLHFTGQFRPEHYHLVLDRFLELKPDLIIVSGDIIDYDRCMPWIEPILGRLRAPHGCSFVLGNHDRRVSDVPGLVAQLTGVGHFDLGARNQSIVVKPEARIELIGNERPWLTRHQEEPRFSSGATGSTDTLRLGVSHSPDQLEWARRHMADLLLAGHTHGGQVRPPGIGPLVSPSWHGSRFASGVFYRSPTLMHVSRGVSGTHPLRCWCPPEVSLLELTSPA